MRAPSLDSFSRIVGDFYDAAQGLVTWPDALAELGQHFDSSRTWLLSITPQDLPGYTSIEDPGFYSPQAGEAMLADPFFEICRSLAPGEPKLHGEIHDVQAFQKRELWQEWLRPRDIHDGMLCLLRAGGDSRFLLEISRGAGQQPFGEAERSWLRRLLPHLSRAGALAASTANARPSPSAGCESPVATILVDQALRVVEANAAAEELLDRTAGAIGLTGSRLALRDPASARALQGLVASCVSGDLDQPRSAGGLALISTDADPAEPVLLASVSPVLVRQDFALGVRRFASILLRPVRGGGNPALDDVLASLFGLTPSQARLAGALASGASLRQAAAERGLSYASARTYLEHIFRQTGTRRQPELVALLKTIEAAGLS